MIKDDELKEAVELYEEEKEGRIDIPANKCLEWMDRTAKAKDVFYRLAKSYLNTPEGWPKKKEIHDAAVAGLCSYIHGYNDAIDKCCLASLRSELTIEEIKDTFWDNCTNIPRITESGVNEVSAAIHKAIQKKKEGK